MLATPKDKKRLYLATSLCDGLEDNNIQQIVMLLMTKDADPNILVPNYGITPFHLVVGNDSETFAESVTKLFLRHSGNPNVKSIDGLTPVHVAAAWGRSKVLELLLANGGDPLCIDNDGRSPFHYAFDGKYYQSIATLSKYCNNLTNDDGIPKYNIKLDKILLSTGNLLAEYEPLQRATYDANSASNCDINYKRDKCIANNQSNHVDKDEENATQKFACKNALCLLNHPSSVKTYQYLAGMENGADGNISIHCNVDSTPRTNCKIDEHKLDNCCINKAMNSVCISLANNCISSNKWNKDTCCNKSTCTNCFHTSVSANMYRDTKEQCQSFGIKNDQNNECMNTDYIDKPNHVLSDIKTPTKSYFHIEQNSSSKRKKKMLHANKERLLGIKTCASNNPFITYDQKCQVTPKRDKYNNLPQYSNIKVRAQSTPRKKCKYFPMRCKSLKCPKRFGKKKDDNPKHFMLDGNDEDKIKNMSSNMFLFNQTFHTDIASDFHTSPDNETFLKRPKNREYNCNFAVNLNNGKYDEDETFEDSIKYGNDYYSIDSLACKKDKNRPKYGICEHDVVHVNTFKLSDIIKDTADTTEVTKILLDRKSDLPPTLLEERDLLEKRNKKFATNQLLQEYPKVLKQPNVAGNDEKLSLYSLCLQNKQDKKSTHNTVHTCDVKYNLCSTNKMHTSTESLLSSSATNCSHVSIQQEYIYEDPEEEVVLLERRYSTPASNLDSTRDDEYYSAESEDLSTKPSVIQLSNELLMMDNENLRQKLVEMGDIPGPITATTKHVYLKRLMNLESKRNNSSSKKNLVNTQAESDAVILQPWLRFDKWLNDLPSYAQLEKNTFDEFVNPDQSRRWREGTAKTCFNYLLLDSRITLNLPNRNNLSKCDIWGTFLSAIFYVGKGKRSRPYAHLYDAFNAWVLKDRHNMSSRKIGRILDMWNDGHGVVCLHIFQNIIPVEAYTREAAMIEALGLSNLDNCKSGDYYGITTTWSTKKKRQFGRYLLYRAMQIFMYEGERQLFPEHL